MYQTRPDDYAAFRCLAGACPQTCCAAWEIVVDPDAQDAYLRLQHPLAAKLRRVLRVDSEGDTYFAQTDGRCPFLCADGLCELQRTLGEQSLCRTCRDFPRWEVLLCDRVEQGLSPACPEAARRLLERSAPLRFVSAPLPDDGYVPSVRERRLTAAVTAVRDRVLALLARPEHTAYENLAAARAFACAAQRLLDRHRIAALAAGDVPGVTADAAPEPMPPAALAAAFASPEPLDARWPELLRRAAALPACPPPRMTPMQQTCLAQTIVWRHGMDALDDDDGIIDHNRNGKHHGRKGQQVDTEANQFQYKEGGNQRHGNGDGGNQRGAHILQEDIHYDEHQDKGLDQCLDYLMYGSEEEVVGTLCNVYLQAGGQFAGIVVQSGLDIRDGLRGITACHLENDTTHGFMSVYHIVESV